MSIDFVAMRADPERAEAYLMPHPVSVIIKAVADYYNLSLPDILSHRRARDVARPRQVVMFLAKHLTTRSYPDIGRRINGRDHTTVMHGVRVIEREVQADPMLAADVRRLHQHLLLKLGAVEA